jgi:hypothetical protein
VQPCKFVNITPVPFRKESKIPVILMFLPMSATEEILLHSARKQPALTRKEVGSVTPL